MAATTLTLSYPEHDIAVLTFDDPQSSANVLSRHVLDALQRHLDELDRRQNLAGLVIRSAKSGMFIAGADIKEFLTWIDSPKEEVNSFGRRGQQLFGRLSRSNYVSVAAIDGMCVGGGAELAIWCDRRIFTESERTAYGFPEVKLGLFPGWGGTVRAPRIVGLANAIEMITTGEPIDARAAAEMGLAVDFAPPERLLAAATAVVRDERKSGRYLSDRKKAAAGIPASETELVFLGATASALIQQETKGNY